MFKLITTILIFSIAMPVMARDYSDVTPTTTGRYIRVQYYSDEDTKDVQYNLEGIDRYNDCKRAGGELYVGDILSFDCSSYTSHEDYLQQKMTEIEQRKTDQRTPVVGNSHAGNEELLKRIDELEKQVNKPNWIQRLFNWFINLFN